MACVLDHGSGDCGDCVCGVSERREGIVEEIANEFIYEQRISSKKWEVKSQKESFFRSE